MFLVCFACRLRWCAPTPLTAHRFQGSPKAMPKIWSLSARFTEWAHFTVWKWVHRSIKSESSDWAPLLTLFPPETKTNFELISNTTENQSILQEVHSKSVKILKNTQPETTLSHFLAISGKYKTVTETTPAPRSCIFLSAAYGRGWVPEPADL